MSLIVPWTDPGGTPCCCQECNYSAVQFTSGQDISISAAQYASFVAGGTFDIIATPSVQLTGSDSICISIDANWSSYQKTRFDHSVGGCEILYSAEVIESNFVAAPSLSVGPFCSNLTNNQVAFTTFGSSFEARLFNSNGPTAFGIRVSASISASVGYSATRVDYNQPGVGSGFFPVNIQSSMTAQFPPTPSTAASNVMFELTTPTGTLNLPGRYALGAVIGNAFTYSQSLVWNAGPTIAFSPSAP